MPAGGGDEEGMRGTRERGVRARGGTAASGGGRGETGGGEKTVGGGRKETVGRGCPRGGAGVEGAGVAARQVAGGIPAVPTEGGGHRRPGAMPRLPVKEDGVYSGVSGLFSLLFIFC